MTGEDGARPGYWPVSFVREIEETKVEGGIGLWALGGASFAVKAGETLVYIDPYLGGSVGDILRLIAIPIDPARVEHADAVLSTHAHTDHCDEATLRAFEGNTKALFMGPRSSAEKMRGWGIAPERIDTVQAGDTRRVGALGITALRASDPHEKEAVTFLVEGGGVTVFHSGDSHYSDIYGEVGAAHEIDVALLDFGKEIYMDADGVIQAALDLGAKVLVPMHWDIWKPFASCPCGLAEEVRRRGLPLEVRIMVLGDRLEHAGGGGGGGVRPDRCGRGSGRG